MTRPPSLGVYRVEQRALRPSTEPNGNVGIFPSTVGEDVDTPGDAHGLMLQGFAGLPPAIPLASIVPSPWSGWPGDWLTPQWGSTMSNLVDTANQCLDLNSSVVASMPPYFVGASSEFARVATWIENPDPDIYASWWEFIRTLIWDYELGEAFLLATARNRFGYPARFHVVEPWMVDVEMSRGLRRYRIGGIPVPDGDLLHLRYKSTGRDAHGHGPLEWGRYRYVAAAAYIQYATTLVSSGGIPPGIIEGDDPTTAAQAEAIQAQWHDPTKLGMQRVTFGGFKWRGTQISPKDMSLVELEQMNAARIASLLRCPPSLVALPSGQDSLTYSTQEGIYMFHWRAHLRTIVDGVLQAMSQWLSPRGTRLEVDREDYIAPSPSDAAQIAATLHGIQETDADGVVRYAMTIDEYRTKARLNEQARGSVPEGVLR